VCVVVVSRVDKTQIQDFESTDGCRVDGHAGSPNTYVSDGRTDALAGQKT
jgi:hypothetical protein